MIRKTKRLICISLSILIGIASAPQTSLAFSNLSNQVGSSTTNATYVVTFDANGGNVSTKSKNVTYKSTYGTLPKPTKKNYEFLGWYTLLIGGTRISEYSTVNVDSADILYAHWRGKESVITLDPKGGVITSKTLTVRYGMQMYNLPTPTRTNYTFDGWYTAAKGGELLTKETKYSETMKKTIYAHWTQKTITITFIPWNGEDSYTKDFTCGKAYGKLPAPTMKNSKFQGWFTYSNLTKIDAKPVTETTIVKENDSTELFARWY